MPQDSNYTAVIIGAGHNGLVCASYLARAGWKVLVLERRGVVGGCAVTEETWPGYKVSTAAYVISLLLPEIERDLELAKHGYRVLPRNPSSFTPLPDGRFLLLGPDREANLREIGKFSQRDAEAYPRYEAFLSRVAECLEPVLESTPPDLLPLPAAWRRIGVRKRLRDVRRGWSLYTALRRLGEDLPAAIELLTGAARTILDRWFESDALKATLATDAVIGTFQPISAPGTAYVLLHHVMGSAGGERGVWGYVEGGMGGLSQALARAAESAGVEIRLDTAVEEITARDGAVTGVRVAGGEHIAAERVASNVDAHLTFERLLGREHLPEGFRRAVERIDYSSASLKINLAVRELPSFTCLAGPGSAGPTAVEAGPEHRGTIHIGPSLEYLERAYADARGGRPSEHPLIEMTIPSSVDPTLAPPGRHVISLFVQYAPCSLSEGTWDEQKEAFADRCVAEIAGYAPNFPASIVHRQVLSPVDLERTFGLTGGNIFQGAMSLGQLVSLRPVPGWSDYRTPVRGLYLCGSAAHPGGGVMGACGRNSAGEMLRDGR
ncbi:MAG TPA: NAD(P)/FAD-dependent oxidoreductase [Planctomycetaceae bacterium]|nr:NAD(P)/FAD-dependent oxidoreductase [Planctomycetaceae bacterium]